MRFLVWLLHERVLLMGGTLIFSLFVLLLIHWNASSEHISIFSGILGMFAGALLRGIIGHNGDNSIH